MKANTLLIALVLGTCALKAADFKEGQRLDIYLLDGRKFENAKITAIEADRIIIINREGAFTIRKDELAREHQQAIGWSSEASAAHRAEVEKAEREAAQKKEREEKIAELERQVASVTIDATIGILQVTDDGFLCNAGSGVFGVIQERVVPAKYVDDQTVYSETHRGLYGDKTYSRTNNFKRMTSPERKEKYRSKYIFDDLFFVEAPPQGYIDGGAWAGKLWLHGTYAYTNTMGARKTVRRYTAFAPDYILVSLNEIEKLKDPNKTIKPTPAAVTPSAGARAEPSTATAGLEL